MFQLTSRKTAIILLLSVAIVTLLAVWKIRELRFDYHFESFFPSDDPELAFFNRFKEKFGNDNDYILIGILNREGIYKEEFVNQLTSLTDSLKNIPFIESVVSPATLGFPVSGPLGPVSVNFLHPGEPERLKDDSARIRQMREITGSFFSADGKAVNILLTTIPEPSKSKSDSIILSLNDVLDRFDFDEVHVAGKVPAQHAYIGRMQQELQFFISIAVLLLIVMLAIMFRSFWAVVIPLIIVFLSMIWLLGIMGATGKNIDLIMTLMPTMLFVVGMSDVIHMISRYNELIREGRDKIRALRETITDVGLATFLTSVTTAIGFLTLMGSAIQPVREFGMYIAIGVGLALSITLLVLPPVLILVNPPGRYKYHAVWTGRWGKLLRGIMRFVLVNKTTVVIITITVIIVSLFGISRIDVNSYLLEDLRKDDPLRKDFNFMEERFGGVRPMEIMVDAGNGSVWDYTNLVAIEKVSLFLHHFYQSGEVVSPSSFVKLMNQAHNGGNPLYYRIPSSEKEYEHLRVTINRFRKSSIIKKLATADSRFGRISARMPDSGSRVITSKDEAFYRVLPELTKGSGLQIQITGTARLIDKNISYMSVTMVQGLLIAFLIIALIAGIMFRSAKMVLIALIPNIIPLLMIAGLMGFLGIDLKVSTSIIFTIAFGIAVDDTIHFLSRFRLELAKGSSVPWAVRRTFTISGKAIILTSLVLVTGFFTLIFSGFEGTWLVGLLISLTLLFAVLADLFLLPLLLLLYRPEK